MLPVPAAALMLFVVIAGVLPQLGPARSDALRVVPVYVAFAVVSPLLGCVAGQAFGLDVPTGRALPFSAATRNSLVALLLAFAVPGSVPRLPAGIVMQTLVEVVSELLYVRLVPRLGSSAAPAA